MTSSTKPIDTSLRPWERSRGRGVRVRGFTNVDGNVSIPLTVLNINFLLLWFTNTSTRKESVTKVTDLVQVLTYL